MMPRKMDAALVAAVAALIALTYVVSIRFRSCDDDWKELPPIHKTAVFAMYSGLLSVLTSALAQTYSNALLRTGGAPDARVTRVGAVLMGVLMTHFMGVFCRDTIMALSLIHI